MTVARPAAADGKRLEVVTLSATATEALARPVNGRGGYQTLFRRLQAGLTGRVLLATVEDLERLDAMAMPWYGRRPRRGGYQDRALTILSSISWWRSWGRPARATIVPFRRPPPRERPQLELPLKEGD